jgi:signal transduction histidine kinase
VPEAYGATRFTALFVLAAHAHFQGERRGLAIALVGSLALVAATVVRGDAPFDGDPLAFYEVVFVLSAGAAGAVVGSLRTAESASRLRARSLSRRTIKSESEVRRRVAEAIHDGPVQELIGLDMILASARKAAAEGRREEAAALLDDARELAERNIRALRDEIVDLGPYAFEELGFDVAIENCIPVWKRRYRFEVMATIERIELPPEMAGALFRIAQEAVVNAGRHAGADTVSISLRTVNSDVELRVTDNGHGFEDADPLGSSEPGHLGLASMRERAELLDGRLEIESSELGTRVLVRAPLPQPAL